MLPFLPGPGNEAFTRLVKELHQYGIRASAVTVDSPSSKLSDVAIVISNLLDGRLGVRMTPGDVEFFLEEYLVDDDEKIIDILNKIFTALRVVDEEANKGSGNLRSTSHLELAAGEVESFIRDHVPVSAERAGLIPDAVGYDVDLGESVSGKDFRVVLAKSVKYKESVFVDINASYSGVIDPVEFTSAATSEFEQIMELIGLREKPETAS